MDSKFIEAAKYGDRSTVIRLLSEGVDVNTQDEKGWTAILHATESGHIDIVRTLIDVGADVNLISPNGWTPLMEASLNNHLRIVNMLIDAGADINAMQNETPLMLASLEGHYQIVELLLQAGAYVDIQDEQGTTALMLASTEDRLKCVELLLMYGANPYLQNSKGQTIFDNTFVDKNVKKFIKDFLQEDVNTDFLIFLIFARDGRVRQIKNMIQQGNVNVDVRNTNSEIDELGLTPLMLAARNGHLQVVKLLVDAKADLNLKDEYGRTALVISIEWQKLEISEYLIKEKADVNIPDIHGKAPLFYASFGGYPSITQKLLEAGADVNVETLSEETPLMFAKNIETMKILISAGANVNALDNDGHSALYYVVVYFERATIEMLKFLVASGIKIPSIHHGASTDVDVYVDNTLKEKYLFTVRKAYKLFEYISKRHKLSKFLLKRRQVIERRDLLSLFVVLLKNTVDMKYEFLNFQNPFLGYWTPLMLTSWWADVELTGELLKYGANVNEQNPTGMTALMLASWWGKYQNHDKIIYMLLENGADVTLRNKDGLTALDYAKKVEGRNKDKPIMNLLSGYACRNPFECDVDAIPVITEDAEYLPEEIREQTYNFEIICLNCLTTSQLRRVYFKIYGKKTKSAREKLLRKLLK